MAISKADLARIQTALVELARANQVKSREIRSDASQGGSYLELTSGNTRSRIPITERSEARNETTDLS